jgi:hypothetical protein
MLQSFDAPNGEMSCVRRARSNTPLQALTTLNEPLFVESAQALAARTLKEAGTSDRDRIAYAFRLCTSRQPTAEESAVLLKFLQSSGRDPQGRDAALTAVARVILNLDETITKE